MQDVELGVKEEPKGDGDGGNTEDDDGRQVLAEMKDNLVNGEALVVALNVKEVRDLRYVFD